MDEPVLYEVAAGVATLTLNRPAARNALDVSLADGLAAAVGRAAGDRAARCVVVRGAGGHFSAGGDIGHFAAALEEPPPRREAAVRAILESVHAAIAGLRGMGKPVLAGAEGACAGFGLSLLAACDLAVAAQSTVFTLAYCRIGITPDGGSTWTLPRTVGMKRAMELALLGDRFDASEALAMGLVNRVVPDAALASETAALGRRLAEGPAEALAATKALLGRGPAASLEAQLEAETEAFLAGVKGPEFAEGVRAFREKRSPRFSGSGEEPA